MIFFIFILSARRNYKGEKKIVFCQQVKYTSHRDRPLDERQIRFQNGCREGHTEIAFAGTGTNFQLVFGVSSGNFAGDPRECDFDKEHGKVNLRL